MSDQAGPNTERRRPDRAALCIAVLLLALAALVAWDTSHIRVTANYARIGPTTVPYAIAVFLGLLGVSTAVTALRGGFPEREPIEVAPAIWIVGGLVGQIVLLPFLGFSIATGVLFAATARGLGRKPVWLSLVIGIVLAAVIWVIFAKLLNLRLPVGPPERVLAQGFDFVAQTIFTLLGRGTPQ